MAVIVLPSRWQRQPTGPVEIDWNHGMAGDLMGAFVGGMDLDLTQPNTPPIYTNTATAELPNVGTEYGVARRVGGVSGHTYWQVQRRGVNSATAGMTAWGRVCPLTNPSNVYFTLARNNSSRTFGWSYQVTTRKLSAYLRTDGGTTYLVPGDRVVSAFDWHDAGSVLAGTDLSLYDGGYLAASGTVASGTTPTRFSLGDSVMGAFLLPVCYLWAGAHPEYMPELSRNPWQLFRKRLYKFISLGGGGSIYDVSISESVSASDNLSASAAFGGALAEAVSAADALAAVATLAGALSEASSASDVVSAAAAYAGALSEASSASDAVSASASLTGALSESASAADALAASASFGSALSESVSAADSIDGSIGAATYAAELVESVSAADSLTAAVVYASAIVEAVTAQDAITASAVLGAVLAEVASASDSVGAALVLAAAISEAVSAADGWSGSVGSQVFEVELSEAVSASDAWVALGVLARHGVRGAKAVQTQMSTRANVQTARRYN